MIVSCFLFLYNQRLFQFWIFTDWSGFKLEVPHPHWVLQSSVNLIFVQPTLISVLDSSR
eukprot:Pgem_evm1s3456